MKKVFCCLCIILTSQLIGWLPGPAPFDSGPGRFLFTGPSHPYSDSFYAFLSFFSPSWTLKECSAKEKKRGKRPSASAIIEDNKVYQNVLAGIRVTGSTPVSILSCEIHENGRAGVNAEKRADVMIKDTVIYQNGMGGIDVENASRLAIERATIYKNQMGGLRVQKNKGKRTLPVRVSYSRIFLNLEAGLRSMPVPDHEVGDVEFTLLDNLIYQNQKSGIRVENETKLLAKGNEVYENGTAGIIAHDSEKIPILDIYQNSIKANIGPGIHIYTGKNGRVGIRNNYIFNNERSGIICALRDTAVSRLIDIDIINNTIVANGSKDQGAGVRNDSKGKVLITNNIIAYNYVSGIRTTGCGDYSYNLLFANGQIGNCCEDPTYAPFWVEKVQFSGCSGRGDGGLITDPLFINPDNFNFALRPDSPAIGAARDIFNGDNIASPNKDMGATGGPYAGR